MKKIILMCFVLALSAFSKTEVISLTGEFSEQLGNPFKRVLNINKTKEINIYSEDKDVVLEVESNLSREDFYNRKPYPDQIILKNKSVENVVEDFYSEDYIVKHSKKDAVVVNVLSGTVSLTYNDAAGGNNTHMHRLIGVEVKLIVSVNGKEKEIVMDHKLGKEAVNYKGFITSDDFDFSSLNIAYSSRIIENEIYKILKGN